MFGVGTPKALHCKRTDDSTSRVALDGGIPTNDGFTNSHINSHIYPQFLLNHQTYGTIDSASRKRKLSGPHLPNLSSQTKKRKNAETLKTTFTNNSKHTFKSNENLPSY